MKFQATTFGTSSEVTTHRCGCFLLKGKSNNKESVDETDPLLAPLISTAEVPIYGLCCYLVHSIQLMNICK